MSGRLPPYRTLASPCTTWSEVDPHAVTWFMRWLRPSLLQLTTFRRVPTSRLLRLDRLGSGEVKQLAGRMHRQPAQ